MAIFEKSDVTIVQNLLFGAYALWIFIFLIINSGIYLHKAVAYSYESKGGEIIVVKI